jgi:hypothetical protein
LPINSNFTTINNDAFRNTGLTSVTIPNTVTSIRGSAFMECRSLTSVTLPNNLNFTTITRGVFQDCTDLESIVLPDTVTTIEMEAFRNSGLTSIVLPDSVTSIGNDAFRDCLSLTSVTFPDNQNFTVIPSGAFRNSGLTEITIPNSVTSIGGDTIYFGAFGGCASLTKVTIGNSVTSIGQSAFSGCTNLMTVIFEGTAPPTLFNSSFAPQEDTRFVVPLYSAADYRYANISWGVVVNWWNRRIHSVGCDLQNAAQGSNCSCQ